MPNDKTVKTILLFLCVVVLVAGVFFSSTKSTNIVYYPTREAENSVTHEHTYKTTAWVWVSTKGGTRYHASPRCSNMKEPEQLLEVEAVKRGFTPCHNCY